MTIFKIYNLYHITFRMNEYISFNHPNIVSSELIGSGTFGRVYKIQVKGDDKLYAMKVIHSYPKKESVNTELFILSNFNHPSLVKNVGFTIK